MELLDYLLTGAATAAVIKLFDNLIQWRLRRKAEKEDRAEAAEEAQELSESEWKKQTDNSIEDLRTGLRVILLNRIMDVGQSYIQQGEVDFDDRRRLNQMHSVYHDQLGGNGDLDELMKAVNGLPLKMGHRYEKP